MARFIRIVCLYVVFGISFPSHGISKGETAQNQRFVTGGVGADEREELNYESSKHNIWILTAVKSTGEYLAGANINISTESGEQVLVTRLDGPWLFVDLNPGNYIVKVMMNNQIQTKTLNLESTVRFWKLPQRQLVFYFQAD